jgi:tRNA (guanine37-N1)-methyltransferase
VRDEVVDREISIGDYVLTNGSLPATVLIDAVARQVPGVLGDEDSLADESFENNLLSHPQYTRPAEYRGMKVPEVLLSGNHLEISKWRQAQRMEKTTALRPDLLKATKN